MKTFLLLVFSALLALGCPEFGTVKVDSIEIGGRTFTGCTLERIDSHTVKLLHSGGIKKVSPEELPPGVLPKLGFFDLGDVEKGKPNLAPFADPAGCVLIPAKWNLGAYRPLAWRDDGLGWGSVSSVTTYVAALAKVGDVDNDLTCMFTSSRQDCVQWLRVTANCFNSKGEAATLEKFDEVTKGLLMELKISDAKLLSELNLRKNCVIDRLDFVITVQRESYRFGYGITFKLESKFTPKTGE